MKIHYGNTGHKSKMAAMDIHGKIPLKIFFRGKSRPISLKLGSIYFGLQPIIVC